MIAAILEREPALDLTPPLKRVIRTSLAKDPEHGFQIAPNHSARTRGHFRQGNPGGGVAISPDGRTAAFIGVVKSQTGLWVRPLDDLNTRLIRGIEGYPSILVAGGQIHCFWYGWLMVN